MLRSLFPRLTAAEPKRGADLFAWVVAQARAPHWYAEGKMPDTLAGRFAVLATITALTVERLERDGDQGTAASAALTERFVEAMEAEHRELGLGDPTLGRTVRKLFGALARRVALWRDADAESRTAAVRDSLYSGTEASEAALAHAASRLGALRERLESAPVSAIAEGRIE
ncbi:MAG TPA: ubiquinol-cytochrome C chaperone family protein [Sphingomicrobium sp.]|nr:ubiquinol-cytochrome C chaperone family protein [Sphingomicrobium sp.]